jgi:hypothetical protein
MGDWQPDRSITIDVPDKAIGREKLSRVHLWVVPARVHGRWCSGEARIDVVQRFQRFSATLYAPRSRVPVAVVDGTIAGTALAAGGRDDSRLVAEGDHLRIVKAAAPAAALEGRRFVRCGG